MKPYTRNLRYLIGLLALVAVASPRHVAGQGASERPVFLALPQAFPELDARVVLMREPGRDIVILREGDDEPETLRVALMLLKRLDRENPPAADRTQIVPITGFAGGRELDPERRRALDEALNELRSQPFANVGNLGWGRWMRFRES